jgi:type II secretory pathway pseudopilin PulG
MKLGKFSLAIISTVVALNASAQTYNTGYNTTTVSGQLIDNLWTITALVNTPTGSTFPTPNYPAFVLPAPLAWPWNYTAPPVGAPNNSLTQWDSNQLPAFGGADTNGMITTYTLNFNSSVAGNFSLYFESDNYVDMYLGAVSPANRFYSESGSPANPGDFLDWKSTTVPVGLGANQLNIVVYNYPFPVGNYTGLRVNFSLPVPEPSTFALAASGLVALLAAVKRRK